MQCSVEAVKEFWEANPLWFGESIYPPGTKEFFEEHRDTIISDCFAGRLPESIFPDSNHKKSVLDLGCGIGFWTVELSKRGSKRITAADLTEKAIEMTSRRCEYFHVDVECSIQNAESLTFHDEQFTHVNCQGVIHHTPNTLKCVEEIARVLEIGGTASISVYYRNVILRSWPFMSRIVGPLKLLFTGLKGRKRDTMLHVRDVDELVRRFDGEDNPIGKAFSRRKFLGMLEHNFRIDNFFIHYFPARAFSRKIPTSIHRLLDSNLGFMICANVTRVR